MPAVPPPPPGPPPPPSFAPPLADAKDAGKGRDLLLQSIRQGKTLRKTATNDRSAPVVSGKPNGRSENNNNMIGSATISRSNNLASLFADGIPKLKPVNPNSSQSASLTSLSTVNSSSLHNNIRKPEVARKLVIDLPKRGPPPQPPNQNQKPAVILSSSTSETTLNTPTVNTHIRSASTVSLVSNGRAGRPMKPQVAPKPPAPAPPVAGLNNKRVHRAHSMRAPSSPPIVPITPQGFPSLSKVGGHHASSDSLAARARPGRPPLRAPLSRPPPPPTSAVPPPPPTSAVPPPPPPSVPPPPPPQHPPPPHRPAPPLPQVPPQPPTRHSSMRNGHVITSNDFEARFAYYFHSVNEFPPPQRYMGVPKIYNSKNAVGKGLAPPPPPQVQLGNKMWANNTSSC